MTENQHLSAVLAGLDRQIDRIIRTGLASLATIDATYDKPAQAVRSIEEIKPDLVFLAYGRQPADAITALGNILAKAPDTLVFLVDPGNTPEKILEGFRHGAADFILADFNPAQVLNDVRQAISRAQGRPRRANILTLFSLKGGQGVTSLALNLADQIQEMTQSRVLLLDLNLFMGDITAYLDIAPEFTVFDLSADLARMDKDLLFSSLYRHDSGFYILTTPEEISDAEAISGQDVADMIRFLVHHFDHIVVDTSHELSRPTLEVLARTDTILAVVLQSIPSAKRLSKVLDFFADINLKPPTLNIVLNRYLKNNDFKKEYLEQLFNREITYVLDNDYKRMNQAAINASLLRQTAPGAKLTQQIQDMAAALTGAAPQATRGWKRWLSGGRS